MRHGRVDATRFRDLCAQVHRDGGRLVAPIGDKSQQLEVITRCGERIETTKDIGVVFVKLIGQEGFSE